jgi:hypothetical protein
LSNTIAVFNPSTEEQIAEVPDSDQAAVDAAVARARETFESGVWRKAPASHRANVLFRAARIIEERTDELAALEGQDNGMNLTAARHIIPVSVDMLKYYAGWVGKIHGESANLVSTACSAPGRPTTPSPSSSRSAWSASSSRGTGRSSSRCSRSRPRWRRVAAPSSSPPRRLRSPR